MDNTLHFVVRPIVKSDCYALEKLADEFEQYLNSLNPGRNKISMMTQSAFMKHAFSSTPDFFGLLLEHEDSPGGYILYHFGFVTDPGVKVLIVIDLFVTPELRGKGAGKALLLEVKKKAIESGASIIITSVWNKNIPAQSFYKKIGAELTPDEIPAWWKVE